MTSPLHFSKIIIGVSSGVLRYKSSEKKFNIDNHNKTCLEKISSSKLFYTRDLFAYAFVALFVAFLIIVFVVLPSNKQANGFCVKKDGQVVFYFTNNTVKIQNDYDDLIETVGIQNGVEVTIYTDSNKTNFNVILFDLSNKTAKVTKSTCSHSKDCCYSPAISNSGIIYCAPHGLSIEPIASGGFTPPVTGGIK